MTEQDMKFMTMAIENAVNKAVTSVLSVVEKKTEEACIERIENHERSCPWGLDYDKTKARMMAFIVGAAAGGGIGGGSMVGILFKVFGG